MRTVKSFNIERGKWHSCRLLMNHSKPNKLRTPTEFYISPIPFTEKLTVKMISESGKERQYIMKKPDSLTFPADLTVNLTNSEMDELGVTEFIFSGQRVKINFYSFLNATNWKVRFLTFALTFFKDKTMLSFYFNGRNFNGKKAERIFEEHSAVRITHLNQEKLKAEIQRTADWRCQAGFEK